MKSAWGTRIYLKTNKQKLKKPEERFILLHPTSVTLATFSGKTYNRYKTNHKESWPKY